MKRVNALGISKSNNDGKTPAHFKFANIPELIYKMDPKIELLLIIRYPVTRAVSSFTEFLAKYQIKYDPNKYDNTSKLFEIKVLKDNGVLTQIVVTLNLEFMLNS